MEKKNIVIIEDVYEHFMAIKGILSTYGIYQVFPIIQDKTEFRKFRSEIQLSMDSSNKKHEQYKMNFQESLASFGDGNIWLYIVDFELKQSTKGKGSITGEAFYNNFIKAEGNKTPVIFTTIHYETCANMINRIIRDNLEHIIDNTMKVPQTIWETRDADTIIENGELFKQELMHTIESIEKKRRQSENEESNREKKRKTDDNEDKKNNKEDISEDIPSLPEKPQLNK